ncbi:MAG: peptidoglycan editing factor PgeF [Maricaulis sp.]|jgi:YfiH family protein|uniref:peptidoglycan editing factor PgeF n=1 Tax=Maricaulis sp. TaxID=1486257 RepID=UPI001B188660|nr:peptidoglycan editing factor PgeF [Maricaulis sp.]MBO6728382.1 peptidoglycan editing factor PgeF [Maricaulis sp.]MBO6846699.1 peptidoglycan editing factor PgeF [Maricaulis sp.]MBO6877717.1 peptidoglycan editing factor PgeF [Maricaulis sp.]MDM7984661.1 peptidoglycan editing factor PgeF [Maricaulis sp.]
MSELSLVRCDLLDVDAIAHGFTTRPGGLSEGPYASLNITRSRGDSPEHVAENRERVRRALGLDYLAFATQVHGRAVAVVDSAPMGEQAVGEADALVTNRPGIGLVCQTADCTPILLFDEQNGAVAAIHSGWRGTVQNIVEATLSRMADLYGTRPQALRAAIGPSISPANYRVGPEVVTEFEAFPGDLGILSPRDADAGAQLDVAAACHHQLLEQGVPNNQIWRSELCTYAEEARLFSARRSHHQGQSGVFGGQGGVIGLRG